MMPAALQKIENPVPRVMHPDWMTRMVKERMDTRKQTSISSFFQKRVEAVPRLPGKLACRRVCVCVPCAFVCPLCLCVSPVRLCVPCAFV